MILAQTALTAVIDANTTAGVDTWLAIAPQDQGLPYCAITPVSNRTEYTFAEIIERVLIQFSIFGNTADALITMASALEKRFTEWQSVDGSVTIICSHKVRESGPTYMDAEQYYQYQVDYEFVATAPKTVLA